MEIISTILDYILHIDKHLVKIVSDYRTWTYLIIFMIIFAETGFVVTPFLPGGSLLFAVGALIAKGDTGLNIYTMGLLLIVDEIVPSLWNRFLREILGYYDIRTLLMAVFLIIAGFLLLRGKRVKRDG